MTTFSVAVPTDVNSITLVGPFDQTSGQFKGFEGIGTVTVGANGPSQALRVGLKDGDDATLGAISDAAVTGDNSGSANAHLRGLTKINADVWDSANHRLNVAVIPALPAGGNTIGGVNAIQSGTWTVQPGNTANTTPWLATINQGGNSVSVTGTNALKVDGSAVTQPVSGTFWQATQPISGTVTANIGTSGSLALDATVAKLNVAQAAALGSNSGPLIQGSVTTAAPSYTSGNINPLSLTTAGALRVDASATTQPVSGTVTANQGGTWNITNVSGTVSLPTGAATAVKQPALGTAGSASADVLTVQGIASMTALKVDGSAVTQPVSGTVTANIGTTNGLALDTSVNGLLVAQASTTSGEKGPLVQGAVTTNAPSYTTAQTSPLSLDTAGLLRASLKDTPSNTNNLNVNLAASAATVAVAGTVTANQGGAPWTQNVTQFGGTNVATGTGAGGAGIPRVTVSNDSAVKVWDGTNTANVLAATAVSNATGSQSAQLMAGAFAEQASLSAGSLNADLVASTDVSNFKWFSIHVNTNAYSGTLTWQCSSDNINWIAFNAYQVGFVTGQQATSATSQTNVIYYGPLAARYLRIRMTSYSSGAANGTLELYTTTTVGINGAVFLRDQNNNGISSTGSAIWTANTPITSGGTSDYHRVSTNDNNAVSIKASAGQVYGWTIYNNNAAVRFVKLYNKASAPSPASDPVFRTIGVPPNGSVNFHSTTGLAMGTGIALAAVTGISDTDNTSVGTSDLVIDIDYK